MHKTYGYLHFRCHSIRNIIIIIYAFITIFVSLFLSTNNDTSVVIHQRILHYFYLINTYLIILFTGSRKEKCLPFLFLFLSVFLFLLSYTFFPLTSSFVTSQVVDYYFVLTFISSFNLTNLEFQFLYPLSFFTFICTKLFHHIIILIFNPC